MKKFLKWTLMVVLSVVGIGLIASIYFIHKFNNSFNKKCEIDPVMITIPTDSVSIARGLILSTECRGCHGGDLAGKYFFNDPKIGKIASSNLTRAKASPTEFYTDKDWIRALRHGVGKNGKALFVMPSNSYTHYSDQDLGCLIAYLKTLTPKENSFNPPTFTKFAKILGGAGQMGESSSYNIIDHKKAKNIAHIDKVPSKEYGLYMSNICGCTTCHKPDFKGGKSIDPVAPPVPDISKSGNLGKWTRDQFIEVLKTGKTPEGKSLDGRYMPYTGIAAFSREEIGSIYDYIVSKPAFFDK